MTVTAPSFPAFVESLRVPNARTALSPTLLAEALELPLQKLAGIAGVHRNTVTLAPTSPKLQEAIGDMVRVLSAAFELTGDLDRAIFWFRNQPIADFGHLTAMQLVEQGKAQAVVEFIDSISGGAAG